jgi:hypothetical protein
MQSFLIIIVLLFIIGSIVKVEKRSMEEKDRKHREIVDAIKSLKDPE